MSKEIFNTVVEDELNLKGRNTIHYDKVKDILNFKNEDISKALGIPKDSVRLKSRVPVKIKQRFMEWINLINLVAKHFDGDMEKTSLWFITPNPLLGGRISPRDMIRIGRYEKLYLIVLNALG